MGDNLPMDPQQPQPHDIVLVGRIMPMPAKAWIMQVRRQKHTADVHCVSWLPMKHYRLALGPRKMAGNWRSLGAITCLVCPLRATSRGVSTVKTSIVPCLG